MASYLDTLAARVKQYLPTKQGLNSAGEAILHAPFDAAGYAGDVMSHPQFKLVRALLTGDVSGLNADTIKNLNPIQSLKPQGTPVSTVLNHLHDIIHKDTAPPKTTTQKLVDATIRGGPGGLAGEIAQEHLPESRFKPALVQAAGIVGGAAAMAIPGFRGAAEEAPETITTEAPQGDFGTPKEAARYIVDNKLGGSHEIVAHDDGTYSAAPRAPTNITTHDSDVQPSAEAPPATITTDEVPQEERRSATPAPYPGEERRSNSVSPIAPEMMARIMNDPGAIGQGPVETPPETITTQEPMQTYRDTQELARSTPPILPEQGPDNLGPIELVQNEQPSPEVQSQIVRALTPSETPPPIQMAEVNQNLAPPETITTTEPAPLSPAQLRERSRQEVTGKVTYLPDRIKAAEEANLPDRINKTPYEQGVEDRFHELLPSWAEAHNLAPEHAASYLANLPKDHPFVTGFTDLMNQRPIKPRDPNEGRVNGVLTTAEHQEMDASAPKLNPILDRTALTTTEAKGRGMETPSSPANDKSKVDAAKNFVKNLASNERGSLGYEDEEPLAADRDPVVHKLTQVIKEVAPLRADALKELHAERQVRIAKAMKAMHSNEGFDSLHAAQGALKGEMPKAVFPSVLKHFTPEEVDHLVSLIKQSNRLGGYDKINTMRALKKVLGEEHGEVPTEHEQALLAKVFPKDFIAALNDDSFLSGLVDHATNILGIPRAVRTIGDLGVAFRQTLPLVGTKAFWQAIPEIFKGVASEKMYQESMAAIHEMPEYPAMQEAKLAFTGLDDVLTEREEFAASHLAEKIPGVRRSERGFTGYLNTVRALSFARLYNDAAKWGADVDDPEYLKQLGDFVNVCTGRGSMGDTLDKASPAMAAAFFSPRLQFSRLKYLTYPLNPNFYRKMPTQLKVEYIKSLIALTAFVVSINAIASMFGAKTNKDPRSTDFGRIVVGKTRFDATGSFQPYVRLTAQMATGQKVTAKGQEIDLGSKFGAPTRLDTVTSFLESKASPNADMIMNEFRGKDFQHPKEITGQDMDWKSFSTDNPAFNYSLPMGVEAMFKAGQTYGWKNPMPYAAGAAETFGIGANTYEDKPSTKKAKNVTNKDFGKGFGNGFSSSSGGGFGKGF